MLTVILDAGVLITACKFEVWGKLVIDHLLQGCRVIIVPSVEEEVAVLGASYPDGVAAGERIAREDIEVVPWNLPEQKRERHLKAYALGDGERDSIELCAQLEDIEALVTDDYLAFIAATRLGLQVWMLPDLVIHLVEKGYCEAGQARDILEAIRPRYRVGVIKHSLERLQEVAKNVSGESDRTS